MGPTYTTNVALGVSAGNVAVNGISATATQITAVSFLSGPQGPAGATGATGAAGTAGAAGVGVPAGGTAGQYLRKTSGTDYADAWTNIVESDVANLATDLSTITGNIATNTSAIAGKEPTITAGTTAQYYRGDKTMQTLNQDAVPSGTTNKAYTATEQTKLAGVATGATANSTDATLLNRANHTGTQAESTITNLVSDLAAKQQTLTLTTTGTSGAATLASGTLNIPQYSGGAGGITKGFAIAMSVAL